jgi:hypothetical protein
MIIGTDNSGRDVRIQLDRLVESRMLVQANSGAYNNPRGRLRSLGLIEYQSGRLRARDLLFLEGK